MAETIILDKDGNTLNPEEIDYDKGYLEAETRIKEHHEAVEETPEVNHLAVKTVYFNDGTSFTPTGEDDPHIFMEDNQKGIAKYINLPGEEKKEVRGIELYVIVDKARQEGKEAWDEEETIQRYILYTEEEIQTRKDEKEKEEKKTELFDTGLSRLEMLETARANLETKTDITNEKCDDVQMSVDDLTLMVAEMVAM